MYRRKRGKGGAVDPQATGAIEQQHGVGVELQIGAAMGAFGAGRIAG